MILGEPAMLDERQSEAVPGPRPDNLLSSEAEDVMDAAKKQDLSNDEHPPVKRLAKKLKKIGSTMALKADFLRTRKNQGSTEHINKLYNLFAPFYDLVWPSFKDYVASAHYLVDNTVKDSHHVLDVGTGTGILSLLVADKGNPVVGFDLHPKMLAQTRKKATKSSRRSGRVHHLELCRGDATILPFQDNSFDVVTSGFMLVHLSQEQKVTAVAEMRRVLKVGGELALLESRGELTERYDTREVWEENLASIGFASTRIEDIFDVYRIVFAIK